MDSYMASLRPLPEPQYTRPHLVLQGTVFGPAAPEAVEIVDLPVNGAGNLMPGILRAYAQHRGISNRILYAVPVAGTETV